MAKYSNTVEYNIKTTLDGSGIAKLQSQLRAVENEIQTLQAKNLISPATVKESMAQISQLKTALNSAFNSKLGMLDNKAFMTSINKMQGGLSGIYKNFSQLGSVGVSAFSQIYGQIGKIDVGLKQVSSTSDKIANTLGNTVRWGLIASGFAQVMNAAHQSAEYVKELDESLTNIMMVTNYSREAMNEYAKSANDAAKALGSTTTAMTNATLVFAQQGFDLPKSQQLAKTSTQLANISQQDTATASDEITAYMNAFHLESIDEINNAMSKWAKVANISAADVEELSVASQKAASTAVTVGVNMDQLAAQIAAIETVTREAPENIGNGLKTLYARFSDIGMGETLEDGVNLGKVTGTLEKVGVQVLNAEGNMRQVGDIMEDLMAVWGDLDLTQRSSVATTLAGKFQLSRFTALMNRSDLYKEYLAGSEGETGTETFDEMQAKFEDSMRGRLNKLQSTIESIFTKNFETNDFYEMIDAVTQLVDVFSDLIEAIGGGSTALTAFLAIATKAFSGQIGQGINNFISNRQSEAMGNKNRQSAVLNARDQLAGRGLNVADIMVQKTADATANVNQYAGIMSAEQIEKVNAATEERISLLTQQQQVTQSLKDHTIGLTEVLASQGITHLENETQLKVFIQQLEDEGIKVTGNIEKFNAFKDALSNLQSKQNAFTNSIKNNSVMTAEGYESIIQKAESLQKAISELISKEGIGAESTKVLTEAFNNLNLIVDGDIQNLEQLRKILAQNELAFLGISRAVESVSEIGNREVEVLRQEIAQREALTTALQRNIDAANGYAQSLNVQQIATNITQLASAGMTFAFTLQSLRGLRDVLTNEDLDPFERFEQILLNSSMVAAMVIPTVKELKTVYTELRGALSVLNTQKLYEAEVTAASAAALAAETAVQEANTRTLVMNSLAEESNGLAKVAAANAIEMEILSETALTDAKIVDIAVTNNLSVAEVESIAARMGAKRATDGLTVSLLRQAAAMAAAHPIITAIVVALSALAVGLKFAADAYYADANAAVEAKKTSQELNNIWSDSKERLDTLNTALEELETHKKTLSSLKQGTDEWNKELQVTNDLILSLIEKYPELAQYVHRNTEGLLEIGTNENGVSGVDLVKQITETQEAQAHANALMAQAASAQKSLRSDATDLGRNITWTTTAQKKVQSSIPGQYTTETVTEGHSLTGEQIEALANYMSSHKISANDLTAENIKEAIGVDSAADKIVAAIHSTSKDNIGKLESFSKQQDSVTKGNELRVSEALAGNIEGYDAGNPYEERLAQIYNEAYTKATEKYDVKTRLTNVTTDDLASKYNKLMDGQFTNLTVDRGGWGKDDDKVTFLTAEGKELEMSRQALEQAVASGEALQAAAKEWESVAPAWKAAAEHAGDLVGIFNGKGGFNKEALVSYFGENDGQIDISGMTPEDFTTLGFEDAEAFKAALQQTLEEEPIEAKFKYDAKNFGGDFDETETSDLLKDSGVSENAFTQMSKVAYEDEDGYYQKRQEALKEQVESTKKILNDANNNLGEEAVQDYTKSLEKAQRELKGLEKQAKDTAAMNVRMNKGLKNLTDNWNDLSDTLKNDAARGTQDWYEALGQLDEIMSDLVNIDTGTLSAGFYEMPEVMQAIEDAANGDATAIDRLRVLASQDIVQHMEIQGVTSEEMDVIKNDLLAAQAELQAQLDADPLNTTANLDLSDYVIKLNEMVRLGQITAEQAGAALSSMGIEYEIGTATGYYKVPVTTYETIIDEQDDKTGFPKRWHTTESTTYQTEYGEYPTLEGTHYTGPGVTSAAPSALGGGGKSGGGGGGGGGGKANEPKSVSKSADIDKSKPAEAENDIYEKVNATLEELKDNYSKLNKVKDRTWGKEYRDNAQKGLDLLVKEQKTLDRRIEIAKKYADALKTGKSNLAYGIDMTDKESFASLGLKDSDLDGVIDNYISRFEEVRQAARKLDAEAEDYRNKANAEALAYWQSKGGRLDGEGNVITEASMSEDESEYYSKLVEKQKNHYDKLVEKANEQWELAEKINDVTKDYEDTMNQIRDDEEEQLDLAHEIEDIQIDLYQRSLDMLDTMHDINDIATQMKGFFTKLATDDPFRALTESAQAFENSFKDATYNATAYYNDIIEKLQKEQAQVKANGGEWEKYNEAIEFYNQQKVNAVTNADGLGSGELAQQSRKLTELERWIQNPNAVDNPYGTNTQALYDAYQEQYQKVTDAALEAEERMESVHESVIEAYDKMAEQQDELVQQYDRVDEQLNRTADRVSLYRGEDAYADQAAISKQRAKVALEAGKSSLKALDKYRQQLAKTQEQQELERPQKVAAAEAEVTRLQMALNTDKNNLDLQQRLATARIVLEQAKYGDSEEVKWLKNQIDETTDYVNDKADEAAEHFKDAYESNIDEIAAQTTDKIFGNRDLDLITNDWDWDRDYFGSYKDNVERALETEKLRLKYLDLLDSAQGSSLGIQRQIKDAMDEQLALLENQKTMSEYDVKLANARLEILQKQIALENAQQNKNQMKLRRDTQGNYKYVYAADQDDVRDKQRELLESEFDAYEMSKDANGDAYQQGIALYQQYIEQRTAIEKKYANDTDTMEKELAKLRENYLRAAEANAEDLQNTYDGMIISVQWMAENGTEAVKQMTENVLDALEKKTQDSLQAVGIPWNEALARGLSDLSTLRETVNETEGAAIDAANEFAEAINTGDNSVLNLVNAANESMQESFDDTTESINRAKEATDQLGVATDGLNQKLGAELGAIDDAKAKIREYEKQLNAAQESTSMLASQLGATEKQLADKAKEAEKWKVTYENYKQQVADEKEAAKRKAEEAKKAAEEQKKSNNGGYSNSDIAWGIAQNIWTYGSWGNDPNRHARISERYGEAIANLTQQYINEYWATGDLVNYDSDKWGYASGGYTGTWEKGSGLDGNNGKLAFLHQKELVLNQQDTENILEAVQVMRSIMDITKMASLGSSGFDARKVSQTATDTIEQRVEITAEFPAANSADDIRQALLGLSDAAMQYAYRER